MVATARRVEGRTKESVGARVARLRGERELSRSQLARQCGLHYQTVVKIENDALRDPSLSTVVALCRGLRVSYSELIDG